MGWFDNKIESETELIFYYISTFLATLLGMLGTGLAITAGIASLGEVIFLLVMLFALASGLSTFVIVNNYVEQSYGLQAFISLISIFLMFWGFKSSSISTITVSLLTTGIIGYHSNIDNLIQAWATDYQKERDIESNESDIASEIEGPNLLRDLTSNIEGDLESIESKNLEFVDIYIDNSKQQFSYLSENNSKEFSVNICTISLGVETVIESKLGLTPSNTVEINGNPQAFEYYCDGLAEVLDIIELSYRALEADLDYIQLEYNLENRSNVEKTYSLSSSEPAEEDINYYIDNFVQEKGRGTEEEREKLVELIKKGTEENRTRSEILDLINENADKKGKEAIESLLKKEDSLELEDSVESFVQYLGKGNQRTVSLAADVLGIPESKFKEKVEDKFNSLRNESELKWFKSDIGIETNNKSSEKDVDDLEYSETIKNLISASYSWSEIEEMSGLRFEEFVEELFTKMGYEAEQTSKTGDQGADVIAENHNTKVAIQAKNTNSKVSNSAIQEVQAALKHYNCNKGIVVSTSRFTDSARELAESNDIELWSKDELIENKSKYLDKNSI